MACCVCANSGNPTVTYSTDRVPSGSLATAGMSSKGSRTANRRFRPTDTNGSSNTGVTGTTTVPGLKNGGWAGSVGTAPANVAPAAAPAPTTPAAPVGDGNRTRNARAAAIRDTRNADGAEMPTTRRPHVRCCADGINAHRNANGPPGKHAEGSFTHSRHACDKGMTVKDDGPVAEPSFAKSTPDRSAEDSGGDGRSIGGLAPMPRPLAPTGVTAPANG